MHPNSIGILTKLLKFQPLFPFQELQFSRIEKDVIAYRESLNEERKNKIEEARAKNSLMECQCCFSDDCLMEEMLPCKAGHLFCTDCVKRASEV